MEEPKPKTIKRKDVKGNLMIIGQWIHGPDGYDKDYSPLYPRTGAGAVFGVEGVARSGAGTLVGVVYTKHSTDVDSAETQVIGSVDTKNTGGTAATKETDGLQERVRFQFMMSEDSTSDLVHLRLLPPAWKHSGA